MTGSLVTVVSLTYQYVGDQHILLHYVLPFLLSLPCLPPSLNSHPFSFSQCSALPRLEPSREGLRCLQGNVMPREAQASVAVTLALTAALPNVPAPVLAEQLAAGLFGVGVGACPPTQAGPARPAGAAGDAALPDAGVVFCHLRTCGTTLAAELCGVGLTARLCAVKGLVTALPPGLLCAPLARGAPPGPAGERGSPPAGGAARGGWTLLVDGAIPAACEAVEAACDTHVKYQGVSVLVACLGRIRDVLEVGQGFGVRVG
jgi:hypothetical protein